MFQILLKFRCSEKATKPLNSAFIQKKRIEFKRFVFVGETYQNLISAVSKIQI